MCCWALVAGCWLTTSTELSNESNESNESHEDIDTDEKHEGNEDAEGVTFLFTKTPTHTPIASMWCSWWVFVLWVARRATRTPSSKPSNHHTHLYLKCVVVVVLCRWGGAGRKHQICNACDWAKGPIGQGPGCGNWGRGGHKMQASVGNGPGGVNSELGYGHNAGTIPAMTCHHTHYAHPEAKSHGPTGGTQATSLQGNLLQDK